MNKKLNVHNIQPISYFQEGQSKVVLDVKPNHLKFLVSNNVIAVLIFIDHRINQKIMAPYIIYKPIQN